MTVIAIRAPGGPDVLIPEERPLPALAAGEVLVKVAAAGVNQPDVRQREGNYPPPKGTTDIPGLEIAGEVVALGSDVKRWKIGDKVCALVVGGGYAQYCAAHETHALPVPESLSMVEAAVVPETFFTVWYNLFERGKLKSGEWAIVHGGTSGIGTTAIMLAKAFGAKVIATAGSAEKCEAARKLGADVAVNYRTQDFVAVTKSTTNGHGADVILDIVGGDYVSLNYEAAAVEGRILQVSFIGSPRASVDLRRLMFKRLTHTGSTLRARPISEKAGIARAVEDKVWPLLAAGEINPVIDSTFPLQNASAAHRRMETGLHIGKIVLAVQPTPQ